MPTARCDDLNCSCRSPELQWFTDQVLRRDATKTDYLVIPLVAGVMARAIIAEDGKGEKADDRAALLAQAEKVIALADRGRTEAWDDDLHAYGVLADLVFCNWPALMQWGGISYERATLDVPFTSDDATRMAAAVRFIGAQPAPSLTESVLMAMMTLVGAGRGQNDLPLLGKAGRRLRVVLADRLRRQGLVTWPQILIAAVDDWTLPTLERLALHNARAGDAAIQYLMDAVRADKAAAEQNGASDERPREVPPRAAERDSQTESPATSAAPTDHGEAEAAEQLIEDAAREIQYWRSQRDVVQHERDNFAQRDARSRSRVESLERQLASERVRRQALEGELAELQAERDRFAERMAADEAVLDDAPPPPDDTFAGRRVLCFTGVESADTRAALAEGFWKLGAAQVDTYWTDKTRGPDAFPADAVVAIDVSFMSHPTWSALVEKAKSAGAWYYWGKHGSTTMARATAAAWARHRERAENQ